MKAAVVGCGLVATQKYFPALRRLGRQVEVAAICDTNEEVLSLAKPRVPRANSYTDLNRMLEEEQPDLVVLCTPPGTHMPLAMKALDADCNILIEKPMALTSEDCDAIIQGAERAGRKVGVMHNQLYNRGFIRARELAERGSIGDFVGMRIMLMTHTDYMTSDKEHWAHRLPGGVLGETGPHPVYLSLPWIGHVDDSHIVIRRHLPEYHWSIGDYIHFTLAGELGLSAITLVYGSRNNGVAIEVFGTDGVLKVDLQTRTALVYRRRSLGASTVAKSVVSETMALLGGMVSTALRYPAKLSVDPHEEGLRRFLRHLDTGEAYPSSGVEGREVVRVMEMITAKSGQPQREVTIP